MLRGLQEVAAEFRRGVPMFRESPAPWIVHVWADVLPGEEIVVECRSAEEADRIARLVEFCARAQRAGMEAPDA